MAPASLSCCCVGWKGAGHSSAGVSEQRVQGSSACYCDLSVSSHAGGEAPAVRTQTQGYEGKTNTDEGQGQRSIARLERRAMLAGSAPGSVVTLRALE